MGFGLADERILSIPIREGVAVNVFGLPLDLTPAEAAKIGRVLVAMSTPAPSGRRVGGIARAASLTPERRSEIARIGAKVRWGHPAENDDSSPSAASASAPATDEPLPPPTPEASEP